MLEKTDTGCLIKLREPETIPGGNISSITIDPNPLGYKNILIRFSDGSERAFTVDVSSADYNPIPVIREIIL